MVRIGGVAKTKARQNRTAGAVSPNSSWDARSAAPEEIWDNIIYAQAAAVLSLIRALIFSALIVSLRPLATTSS